MNELKRPFPWNVVCSISICDTHRALCEDLLGIVHDY